ncbi:phosphatase PAP2 family protein [bacterium SCSIO 12643]|nr:phosphatase PAP2 family protein [bacterium SCSIO 12643]
MIQNIQKHKLFFGVYALLFSLSGLILLLFEKKDIHLFINNIHGGLFDFFFKYFTYVGDGFAFVAVALACLFISKRLSLQIILTGVLVGIISQFFKKVVFGPVPRPSAYFEQLDIPLYFIDGVDMHTAFSFPSGHTTAIFGLTTALLLAQKNTKFDFLLILIAVLVGYSRMYLSQHFLIDVFAGSILGILIALLAYNILYSSKMKLKVNLDQPLINFHTK